MKARHLVYLMLCLVLAFALGWLARDGAVRGYVPPVSVYGDVDKCLTLSAGDANTPIALQTLLQRAHPWSDAYTLMIIARDGKTATLAGPPAAGSLQFDRHSGWNVFLPNHPAAGNLKHVMECIVSAPHPDKGLPVINRREILLRLTPGQVAAGTHTLFALPTGQAEMRKHRPFHLSLHEHRAACRLADITTLPDTILLMGTHGETTYAGADDLLMVRGNGFAYYDPTAGQTIPEVAGIFLDPPAGSISDVFHDALALLERDQQVLVIVLDGFGFHQFLYGKATGACPFLAGLRPAPRPAVSVYQPVTQAGLAAMLSGTHGGNNGVYSRKQRSITGQTLFDRVKEMRKRAIWLEGNLSVLSTSLEAELTVDENQDQYIDDDIFRAALTRQRQRPDLLFVHFHSIDDAGHRHGDLAADTMANLRRCDGYVASLLGEWPGAVIITADHGMHATATGGDHGTFRPKDLIVPYWLIQGD